MVWGNCQKTFTRTACLFALKECFTLCFIFNRGNLGIITLRIITSIFDGTVNKGGVLFLSYFLWKVRLKQKITNFENKLVYLSGGYLGELRSLRELRTNPSKKFRWRGVRRDDLRQRLSVKEPGESLLARPLFTQQISIISCASSQSTFEFKDICFLFSI